MRQLAAGLLDELRGGGVVVRPPVRVVAVLIGIEIPVGIRGMDATRFADRAVGAFERARENQLGPERAQNQLAFRARVFGQAERHLVAARRADHRVRDAGVA